MWFFLNTVLLLISAQADFVERNKTMNNTAYKNNVRGRGEQPRVVNGIPQPHSSLPFLVSLQKNKSHYCSGSIVAQDFVLTACQCLGRLEKKGLLYFKPKVLQVVAGVGVISESSPQKQTTVAKKLIAHPKCSYDNVGVVVNDVGIIKLSKSLTYNNEVKPVRVFSYVAELSLSQLRSYQRQGAECTTAGWGGKTKLPGTSDVLLKCVMALRTPVECRDSLCKQSKAYCGYRLYLNGQTCGVPSQRNCLPCGKDEGGPLICEGYLYGIITLNSKCDSNFPSVFAHIKPILYMINTYSPPSSPLQRNSNGVMKPVTPSQVLDTVLLLLVSFHYTYEGKIDMLTI